MGSEGVHLLVEKRSGLIHSSDTEIIANINREEVVSPSSLPIFFPLFFFFQKINFFLPVTKQ